MSNHGLRHSKAWQSRREFYRKNNRPRESESVPAGHSESHKHALRLRLYNRQHGKCAYCNFPFACVEEATIDHLIPLSRGGTWYFHNLRLACLPCNASKGNLLPDDPEWEKPGVPRVPHR